MAEKQAEKQANKQIAPMSQWRRRRMRTFASSGWGPAALEDLTLAAWQLLTAGGRGGAHAATSLPGATGRNHGHRELRRPLRAARRVRRCLRRHHAARRSVRGREPGGVTYAVPGHPWVGEATTPLIQAATEAGLSVSVTGGLSFRAAHICRRGRGPDGWRAGVVDAMLLAKQHHPKADVSRPLLVGQLYVRWLASDVKLTLLNAYPDDHTVAVIPRRGHAAGTGAPSAALRTGPQRRLRSPDEPGVPPLDENGSFTICRRSWRIYARRRAVLGPRADVGEPAPGPLGECAEVLEAIDLEADGRTTACTSPRNWAT